MIKSIAIMLLFATMCYTSDYAKLGAMLSIENMQGVESVRPLDSLWSCVVVDIVEGASVNTDYIIGVFKLSGFDVVRFLLPDEVLNIVIVE